MTTADYLEQLQQDRSDLVDNLETKGITGLTGDETFTELVPEVLNIPSGTGTKEYTGHYDTTGLATIGWTSDDINFYQDNGVVWDEENDNIFKLNASELAGDTTSSTRFLPKNASLTSYTNYYSLIGVPYITIDGNNGALTSVFETDRALTAINVNFANTTSLNLAFNNCSSLKKIKLSTSGTLPTNLLSMFMNCHSLEEVDLSNFDTSQVTTIEKMFNSCYAIKKLKLDFDITNVSSMVSMFANCRSLKVLDLSSWHPKSGTSVTTMLNNCTSLQKLDMRNFDFTILTNATSIFGSGTTQSSSNVQNNCLIIVADQTQKNWIATNFARLTNVKTVSEYEGN